MSELKTTPTASRDTKWVEGLRGLASVLVMTSHLALGYADFLEAPRGANEPPYWYNLPFLRVAWEGSPWVSVFLILTGFVNALKPLKQSRSGEAEAALASLASSCFRRSLRLMLPCTFATLICFVLAECGGFKTGSMVMSGWMGGTSPLPSGGVWKAICTLFRAVLDTWSWNHNELERNQWAMLYFLKGALAVYIFLLATVRTQWKWRMCIAAGLVYYGWRGLDPYIFMPMFTGVLLAEASMTHLATTIISGRRSLRLLPYAILLLGWYCISFPNRFHRRMPWSAHMLDAGLTLFPLNADIHAFYSHIGASLIITAITFSGSMQRFFNLRPFQWLGARSFPIYLVHGPVLRSFLNWILFHGADLVNYEERDEEGVVVAVHLLYPIPPLSKFLWAVPLFLVVVFMLADLWLKFVEPKCGRIAKRIEDIIYVRQSEQVVFTDKTNEEQVFALVEGSSGSPRSPFSRATTPLNDIELILPR